VNPRDHDPIKWADGVNHPSDGGIPNDD
jgi:hypothetical protein